MQDYHGVGEYQISRSRGCQCQRNIQDPRREGTQRIRKQISMIDLYSGDSIYNPYEL